MPFNNQPYPEIFNDPKYTHYKVLIFNTTTHREQWVSVFTETPERAIELAKLSWEPGSVQVLQCNYGKTKV